MLFAKFDGNLLTTVKGIVKKNFGLYLWTVSIRSNWSWWR